MGTMNKVQLDHQRFLALGATLCILGLAMVGIKQGVGEALTIGDMNLVSDLSGAVVLAGLLTLVYSIHRFGRLGRELGKKPRKTARKNKTASKKT
jgi:prepilin signal peptidase PulO-like enzyme (type II secretory pathway)